MARKNHFAVIAFTLVALACAAGSAPAQPAQDELTVVLDDSSPAIPLPAIFSPNIDLSGRGFHADITWPQTLASQEALESWQKDIGFKGTYRLQYNLWEISQLDRNKELQGKLLDGYDAVMKSVSDAGGTVILDIFSTPQGQGRVLDRKSSPADLQLFKQLIKNYMRHLSCDRKFRIWYEVWSAPDLDEFFLGRQSEYLDLYRCVAEAAKELEGEARIHIPVGGPSTSWWLRGFDDTALVVPERSLIYALIKFCYQYKLPLDFISWHAYSTDPGAEKEMTGYNKTSVELVRTWLSYFNFPAQTPLVVDEWNFDSGFNVLEERGGRSYVAASYVLSRLKGMYEAGLSSQVFFSLEDFQENREGVVRNTGLFWYEEKRDNYSGGSKPMYGALRMLSSLGENLILPPKGEVPDEFAGSIATKGKDAYAVILYNYIDPDIFRSYIARYIAPLNEGERRGVVSLLRQDGQLDDLLAGKIDVNSLKLTSRAAALVKRALEHYRAAEKHKQADRNFKITVKGAARPYICRRYVLDEACGRNCPFAPIEQKELALSNSACEEIVALAPYSAQLLVLSAKPEPPPAPPAPPVEVPAPEPAAPEQAAPAAPTAVEANVTVTQPAAQAPASPAAEPPPAVVTNTTNTTAAQNATVPANATVAP